VSQGHVDIIEDDWLPLKVLTPQYLRYVTSDTLRPVLIQILVIRMVVENVLKYSDSEPIGFVWAGTIPPS
jgi:hypothetical protein